MSKINSYRDFISEQLKIQRNSTLSRAEPIAESSTLEEGNPLARIKKFGDEGRHFAGISAVRTQFSDAENNRRHEELKKKLSDMGYGFREVEGHWEGGKEKSIIVNAKEPGHESGRTMLRDVRRLAIDHATDEERQDSIYYHNGTDSYLIGTNEKGYPGKNKVDIKGAVQYNRPKADFQTEMKPKSDKPLKPGRTSKGSARFTSGEEN